MFARYLTPEYTESFFLFGPRGVGKTSWLQEHFRNSSFINLLESDTYTAFKLDPSLLRRRVELLPKGVIIIIDEVQKIPELLDEVHLLIEKEKRQFILTGSSARKLKRSGTNLLAGRALLQTMQPLTSFETGSQFNLEYAIEYGILF